MNQVIRLSTRAPEPPAQVTLPGLPASVPIARGLVREALPACPRAGDLALAVSELATNAITWSASGRGGFIVVRVRVALHWARAEVTDEGPAPGDEGSSNGWGLLVVAGITDRSGSATAPDGSRTAWAEVTW